jgi:hypothetical protein
VDGCKDAESDHVAAAARTKKNIARQFMLAPATAETPERPPQQVRGIFRQLIEVGQQAVHGATRGQRDNVRHGIG